MPRRLLLHRPRRPRLRQRRKVVDNGNPGGRVVSGEALVISGEALVISGADPVVLGEPASASFGRRL